MENQYCPVVLFAYNRPEHTQKVLNALASNPEAKHILLYIHCDGIKIKDAENESIKKRIAQTRKIAKKESRFRKVEVILQDHNKGLARSIIEEVSRVINIHGKIIVLEDDTIPSIGFLKYMNAALAIYQDEEKVGCVHAWNYDLNYDNYPDTTFFLKGADCWGWATWERAWQLFEPDGRKLLQEIKGRKLVYSFDRNGTYPFTKMLEDQINGSNDSWAIRWHASLFLKEIYCLQPVQTLILNIGMDGSGTHSGVASVKQVVADYIEVKKIPVIESDWFFKEYNLFLKNNSPKGRQIKTLIKKIAKKVLPVSIRNFLRRGNNSETGGIAWTGEFASWQEAEAMCTGYDNSIILEKCKSALLEVKNGTAVYERDSVIFEEIQYSWSLLAGLQKAALENDGNLCVLDFGGSLGSTYYQNKNFISSLKKLDWCIVEQPHFIECGKEHFESDQLHFYYTIEECLKVYKPDVLLLSSVIQYLKEPHLWIENFLNLDIPYIIIDRTAVIDQLTDLLTIQKVPESIYAASYPCWFFSESHLIQQLSNGGYSLLADDSDFLQSIVNIENRKATWKIFIFKKK